MEANEEFIRRLYPAAIKVGRETGMSWELILAQAAHETGWGRKVLSGTNNLYNIKASADWEGETKTFRVWERDKKGEVYWTNSPFRVYDSFEDSLRDRVRFLRENPRYEKAGLFEEGTLGDLRREAEALERAGYATDKGYADLLVEVFNGRTMRRLVAAASVAPGMVAADHLSERVLREGVKGRDVAQLQSDLGRLGYTARNGQAIAADGHFGEQTRLALQAYQRDHKLQPDGVAGPLTRVAVAETIRIETRSIGRFDAEYLQAAEHKKAIEPYQSVPSYPIPSLHATEWPVRAADATEPPVDPSPPSGTNALDSEGTIQFQRDIGRLGGVNSRGDYLSPDGGYVLPDQLSVDRFHEHEGFGVSGPAKDDAPRSMDGRASVADRWTGQEASRLGTTPTPDVTRERRSDTPPLERPDYARPPYTERPVSNDGPAPVHVDQRMAQTPSGPSRHDPRHPESTHHGLYSELGRRVPEASEDRLLQFTAACHTSRITADNLSTCHLNEQNMTMGFLGNGPLAMPVTVDLTKPPPEPEQAIAQIAQYDQQQALVRSEYLAQQQQMSRRGPSL